MARDYHDAVMKAAPYLLLLLMSFGCASSKVLFDDFSYAKKEDLASNGWILRTASGWPGIPGAAWGPESFSLHDGVLRMTSSTDGTVTRQSQICHQRKYREGTYAARVRFTDEPVTGPNGDQVVETFYFISPLKAPMDLDYSEIDFEYTPNGGWGHEGPRHHATTWETFSPEPNWKADNDTTNKAGSHAGWRTFVVQVAEGKVRYYVDGAPFAEHGGRVYPEVPMSINFNLWFIVDHLAPSPERREWQEDIDWVFFSRARLSPTQVERKVASLRARGVQFRDSVPSSGLASPCNF
jgi:glycosyl hydrolase family 16